MARRRSPVAVLVVLLLATATPALGQQQPDAIGVRVLRNPRVRAAVERVAALEAEVLADQVALCEIPAPPFGEAARAVAYRARLAALGLTNVRTDAAGNVLGIRPGRRSAPHLVLSAHLDTVFPPGTDVTVTQQGSMLFGPGIGDDCRGLAVVLGVVRALDAANVRTTGPITVVGTVGEEGAGDLRGVRHLFETDGIDRFVSVEGGGLGILNAAIGSVRYRITFRGPGGHSFGAFGLASPVHAIGRFVNLVSDFDVPDTTFTVGRVGGGTSVNAIAADAWAEVDLRSGNAPALDQLSTMLHRAVEMALGAENGRWGRGGRLTVDIADIGRRPVGVTSPDAPIVRAALSVSAALGLSAGLSPGSTDANLPIALGIPAIAIGGGGRSFGTHSEAEAFDTFEAFHGTARATLLAVALTEP